MTVSTDVLYLPMLNPIRMPVREHALTGHPEDITHDRPHHVYRVKPRERNDGFAYGPGGYASARQTTGRLIDLFA